MSKELPVTSSLKSIWDAPVGVEILAWHKEGKNFHQVRLKEDGSFGMRWATDYRQHPNCYSGWLPMPTLDTQYTHTSEVIKVLEGSKCKTGTGFRAGYNQAIDDAIKAIGELK